nr:lysozyme M1 [Parasteatoda tepidariorum]
MELQNNYIEGLDISHYNGDINWSQLTPNVSGKQFIIAKASESTNFQDPTFIENWKNMCSTGFTPGAYHFVRFEKGTSQAQMVNLIGQLNAADSTGRWRNCVIALDIEATPKDGESVKEVVQECVQYLMDTYNLTPCIYTTKSYWDQYVDVTPDIVKQCPLWIARYRAWEPPPDELPAGWYDWTIWQYSDEGSVSGIADVVDLNRMKLTKVPQYQ